MAIVWVKQDGMGGGQGGGCLLLFSSLTEQTLQCISHALGPDLIILELSMKK